VTAVILAAGYGVFLLGVAHFVNWYGRKSYGPDSGSNRYLHGDAAGNALDPYHRWAWPHSEAARFTLGIAIVLSVLAVVVPGALLVRHGTFAAWIVLLGLVAVGSWTALRLAGEFRAGSSSPGV
jgi:hypothetical protein